VAVALAPDAFLSRTATTAWNVYFSYCGWRRIDTDRGQTTVLTYLGHSNLGAGFQITASSSRQLIVYRVNNFSDLLTGTGPTLAVGTWYFLGLTTIAASQANGVQIYYAAEGAPSLTQVTATFLGAYEYRFHGVGGRSDNDGQFGAFRLHGSAGHDRTWTDTTLTPAEMLAEFQSPTPVKTAGLWSAWPMADAATAANDTSGNSRPLTATPGTGTITTTDGPFDGTTVEGSLAATLPALTANAGGTATVSGSLAGALPALTAGATGNVEASGSVGATLPILTVSATGSLKATGEAAATLPALDASLTGDAQTDGSMAATLPALTASSTGTVTVEGTTAAVLPPLSAALTGQTIEESTLHATLPALQAEASATVTAQGALGATLPALEAAFTGEDIAEGTLAATLPAITAALNGTVPAIGPLNATLPALTAALAGGAEVHIPTGPVRITSRARPLLGGESDAHDLANMEVTAQ
jgi:hypothetical protein